MKRKILILSVMLLSMFRTGFYAAQAEELAYPFDSIHLIEAEHFQVTVPANLSTESLLHTSVASGDVLNIYMGTIELWADEVAASTTTSMIVVTNALGVDLHRFVVNDYAFQEGVSKTWGFASHILIDPEVGVVKDLDILAAGLHEFIITHDLALDTWSFEDDKDCVMPAMTGTFASETGLDIIIAAYVEVTPSSVSEARRDNTLSWFDMIFTFGLFSCGGTASSSVSNSSTSVPTSEVLVALNNEELTEALSTAIKEVFVS
ncbi:MAG: hypothetical protein NTV44_05310 [Firmicutes bacterium]|nr:hypothetical protein [Bacillota bacterium]